MPQCGRAVAVVEPELAADPDPGQRGHLQQRLLRIRRQDGQSRPVPPRFCRHRRFRDSNQRLQRIGLEHWPHASRHDEHAGLLRHRRASRLPRLLSLRRISQRTEFFKMANDLILLMYILSRHR